MFTIHQQNCLHQDLHKLLTKKERFFLLLKHIKEVKFQVFEKLQRYDPLKGRTTRENAQTRNRKLSPTEESTLVQWILSMDEPGKPLRVATVREMANILLANQGVIPAPTVGVNWTNRFVNRHDELKSRFSRQYDHQRALCEDPKIFKNGSSLYTIPLQNMGLCGRIYTTMMRLGL